MKDFVTYSDFMRNAEAFLEIKLDLTDPVEIGDFAALFAGFGAEFERYLSEHHPESAGTAKMYVSEVRKGSVIAAMRGGLVCLNSFEPFLKWISRSVMPPPAARQGMRSMSRERGLVTTG